jgi:uncharacterized membrane protein YcaP (DUF421 family)
MPMRLNSQVDMCLNLVVALFLGSLAGQSILVRPTMKVELITLDATDVETKWFHQHLMELFVVEKPISVIVNRDNHTLIAKLRNSKGINK